MTEANIASLPARRFADLSKNVVFIGKLLLVSDSVFLVTINWFIVKRIFWQSGETSLKVVHPSFSENVEARRPNETSAVLCLFRDYALDKDGLKNGNNTPVTT